MNNIIKNVTNVTLNNRKFLVSIGFIGGVTTSIIVSRKVSKIKADIIKNMDYILFGDNKKNELIFKSRKEALETLETLNDLIEQYGFVTRADLYELAGITGNFTDNKYGWINLYDAHIKLTKYGYSLRLPQVKVINKENGGK